MYTLVMNNSVLSIAMLMVSSSRLGHSSTLLTVACELWIKNSKPPPEPMR